MRRASERQILASADPAALWRLARYKGLEEHECHCPKCLRSLVEWLARKLEESSGAQESSSPKPSPA